MTLHPGSRIGPYEVTGVLGAGGMGEVYRAHDTRLKRDVALKILPDSYASDPERLSRFQREAEVLASLNHQNIAGIHGIEEGEPVEGHRTRALVLELVEGETLAERISRGPIPFDEVLLIGGQIAEALGAAHDHGVIHRDLKPANIKLRADGTIKVLDFGLAKLLSRPGIGGQDSLNRNAQPPANLTMSPTITSPAMATGVGILLGTAAYMSPEQAKGREADKRSDIFAFGCVLFELATGKRVFTGEDVSDTIAAVLRGDPDWNALAGTPARFATLVKRCLQRDRRLRYHDVGDVRLDLAEIATTPGEVSTSGPSPRATLTSRLVLVAVTAGVAAAIAASVTWALRRTPESPELRFTISLDKDQTYSNTGRHILAISPDGQSLVFSAGNRLNLRALNQLESTPIHGTEEGGRSPFFSPDGQWVAFWHNGQLLRVAVTGGAAISICKMENPLGASWSDDDTILFGQGTAGIFRVPSAGGIPERIIPVASGELAASPQLLPGESGCCSRCARQSLGGTMAKSWRIRFARGSSASWCAAAEMHDICPAGIFSMRGRERCWRYRSNSDG